MKPRSKRAHHSKRLSIKDLALELAKKHVSFFQVFSETASQQDIRVRDACPVSSQSRPTRVYRPLSCFSPKSGTSDSQFTS